jgi:hypothetical protein
VLSVPATTERLIEDRRLLEHALLLHIWLEQPTQVPPKWRSAPFARNVDLVRAHLQPITSHELLARSYGREHFHMVAIAVPIRAPEVISSDATEVAYAVRWLELDRGTRFGPWRSIIADPTPREP